jgi:hypothetical protein
MGIKPNTRLLLFGMDMYYNQIYQVCVELSYFVLAH